MRIDEQGEDGLVQRLLPFLAADGLSFPAGRDDAAVFPSPAGFMVASCDASVEGVHFDLAWMSPEEAGWQALCLALGDLAAKGATPAFGLASLAVPGHWDVEAVIGLYRGMAELGARTSLGLAGGDLSATTGPAVLSLTVLGTADAVPLARSEARPGWAIAVTGPLGGAALALRERRPLRLEPRLEAGRRLNRAGLCCGDVSDGLLRELEKFAAWSGAGSEIRGDLVPVAAGATVEDALGGGEEVELVCVGPEHAVRDQGLAVIGHLVESPAVRVLDASGHPVEVAGRGYHHFA